MYIKRQKTRCITLGNTHIGGRYPILVQSMTNTKTVDTSATVQQIKQLEEVGCQAVRIAVPDMESAKVISEIKKQISIPLIADIHFDFKLAIESIDQGVDGLRINPGNIGSKVKIRRVIAKAKDYNIPIRVGVNCGSLSKEHYNKYGITPIALVESALEHVAILEAENFYEIKISVKGSSVPLTIDAYRLLSKKVSYPLHIGVTEAGTWRRGTVFSSIGIGLLLAEGIGDTIRVSLTDSPIQEVLVGIDILKSLGLRKGLEIVSCPTCGRSEIDLVSLTKAVEEQLIDYKDKDIIVAIMGCVVNGPGEARAADFGIAGGKNKGLLFCKGEVIKSVAEDKLVEELIAIIKNNVQLL